MHLQALLHHISLVAIVMWVFKSSVIFLWKVLLLINLVIGLKFEFEFITAEFYHFSSPLDTQVLVYSLINYLLENTKSFSVRKASIQFLDFRGGKVSLLWSLFRVFFWVVDWPYMELIWMVRFIWRLALHLTVGVLIVSFANDDSRDH